MDLFAGQGNTAIERYRQFIEQGMDTINTVDLSGGGLVRSHASWDSVQLLRKEHEARIGDERILGDSDFVVSVLKNDILSLNKATHWRQKGWDLERLVSLVCDFLDVRKDDLSQKGRQNALSSAKSLICFWGREELGFSTIEIAMYFNISQPAISKAAKQGADYSQAHGLVWDDLLNRQV